MNTPQTCGNCANWTRHEDARMGEHGACTQRPVGHYSHQTFACLFDPSRWIQRKPEKKSC